MNLVGNNDFPMLLSPYDSLVLAESDIFLCIIFIGYLFLMILESPISEENMRKERPVAVSVRH